MTIRALERTDIPPVAALHAASIRSPGSVLGAPYLTALYTSALTVPGVRCLVAEEREIAGAVLVTSDIRSVRAAASPVTNRAVRQAVVRSMLSGRFPLYDTAAHLLFGAVCSRSMHQPYLYVEALFVRRQDRGKGIGTALLDAARRTDSVPLYLDTLLSNTSARSFYARCGFTPVYTGFGSVLLYSPYGFHRRMGAGMEITGDHMVE